MKKIKYYVNGKLVRTSENEYNYAIMCGECLIACSGTLVNAQKRLTTESNYIKHVIEYCKDALNGKREKPKYWDGSKEKWLEACKNDLSRNELRLSKLRIVELEKVS